MTNLKPRIGMLGQDLATGLFTLADRANRHYDVRSGASQAPGASMPVPLLAPVTTTSLPV